jgi:hypothetical protein
MNKIESVIRRVCLYKLAATVVGERSEHIGKKANPRTTSKMDEIKMIKRK